MAFELQVKQWTEADREWEELPVVVVNHNDMNQFATEVVSVLGDADREVYAVRWRNQDSHWVETPGPKRVYGG